MIYKAVTSSILVLLFTALIIVQAGCTKKENSAMTNDEMLARGKYLVRLGGCNDCHSPKIYTAYGPVADTTRLLSGHPEDLALPKIDTSMIQPGMWVMGNSHFTAWVGPWGASFTANLTPDEPTGIGTWTEDVFINSLRTGKHMGVGRPILPPMPWADIGKTSDEDLKAIFAYLKSLPPIRNAVPSPIPPNKLMAGK